MREKKRITAYQICLVAFAAGINIAGGQIALALRLPVYLDLSLIHISEPTRP